MKELHRKAMQIAQDAFILKYQENQVEAKIKFFQAFELEKQVAYSQINSNEPTRSVLFRSAAALAKNAEEFAEAFSLVSEGLKGNPDSIVFKELLDLILNQPQFDFSFSESVNIRLLAPAGSGKTTSILWRCLRIYQETEKKPKFLIFTFTRAAKDELKDRLLNNPIFSKLKDSVIVETINQWGLNFIKTLKEGIEIKASKMDNYFLVKNNIRPLWEKKPFIGKLSNIPNKYNDLIKIFDELKSLGFSHNNKGNNFTNEFERHLLWLSENSLTEYFNERIFAPLKDWEMIDFNKKSMADQLKPFLNFWQKSLDLLWGQSIVSLDDQKYWALQMLSNSYSDGKTFRQRYNHIFVDEFQDINVLDMQLIKRLCELNRSSLTIVGDDDQAIFEWRGSSPNFILSPEKYFDKNFETFTLDINYRSPHNIVEHSQNLIKHNLKRVSKNVKAFTTKNAEIKIVNFENHISCIPLIMEYAREINVNKNENLAIISRKKGQLIPLQIMLTSENIPFYAKEDLNVLLSNAFRDLKKILEAIATKNDRRSSDKICSDILTYCNQIEKFPLKKIEMKPLYAYLIQTNPRSFINGIQNLRSYPGNIKGKTPQHFYDLIMSVVNCNLVSEAVLAIGENFNGLKQHYVKSDDDIFYKDPPFVYLTEYAQRYGDNFWEFIDHVEEAINKMSFDPSFAKDDIDLDLKTPVHLMTAIRAKGKEYDNVIILDVVDDIWPIKQANNRIDRLEQERRLFYVAITRAKSRLILITVNNILNRKTKVSPYLGEMGLQ